MLFRSYGVPIVVGEDTVTEIGEDAMFRKLDNIVVRGKRQSIAVYALETDVGRAEAPAGLP